VYFCNIAVHIQHDTIHGIQATLVIAARVITAHLVNSKKIMGTNLHQR